MKLIGKKVLNKKIPVYDLSVQNNHNYHITKSNIPVHNSGKGFQLEKLVGLEGKVFDVDELKKLAIKSNKFAQRVKQETGYELKNIDLKIPENVSRLHEILSDVYNLPKNQQKSTFSSVMMAPKDRKPNLIFDVTLKDLAKLETISRNAQELGYDKKNIHIVWVVNDLEVAIQQNKKRDRVVPEEILIGTHEGVSLTMKKILDMGDKLKKYLDGAIYITFNKVGVDTDVEKSDSDRAATVIKTKKSRGSYVKDANYIKIKEQGRPQLASDKLSKSIYNKITDYTPDVNSW